MTGGKNKNINSLFIFPEISEFLSPIKKYEEIKGLSNFSVIDKDYNISCTIPEYSQKAATQCYYCDTNQPLTYKHLGMRGLQILALVPLGGLDVFLAMGLVPQV